MSDRNSENATGLEPLAALGEAIRVLRTRIGLSQDDLAAAAGLDAPALAAIEAGREEPLWGDLRRIAQALDTPLEQLLALAERLEKG